MEKPKIEPNPIIAINEKMAKYKSSCGCQTGAYFMTASFILSLIFTINAYQIISINFLKHLPYVLLITIGGAGFGKIVGLCYAKYKYHILSNQLKNYIINLKMEEPNYARNLEKN
jgi:hypothetical protein